MDLRPPLSLAMDAFSLPVTVTVPEGSPVATTGIWLSPRPEDQPVGKDYSVLEPRRVMALPLDDVPVAPRGSVIVAAKTDGGVLRNWQVEGPESVDADEIRVFVIPKTS